MVCEVGTCTCTEKEAFSPFKFKFLIAFLGVPFSHAHAIIPQRQTMSLGPFSLALQRAFCVVEASALGLGLPKTCRARSRRPDTLVRHLRNLRLESPLSRGLEDVAELMTPSPIFPRWPLSILSSFSNLPMHFSSPRMPDLDHIVSHDFPPSFI